MQAGGPAPNPIPSPIAGLWSGLASSPDLHCHQIDAVQQAALFVQLPPAAYLEASFLDGRSFPAGTPGGWVGLSQVLQTVMASPSPATPLHFIFHMGHTGSTLLSRLLDESGAVHSLREPLVLRELASLHDRRGRPDNLLAPEAIDQLTEVLLRLWARCPAGKSCAVLKATSSAARIAQTLMTARPDSRSIYLSMAADPFLAVILGGPASLLDVRGHAEERMRRLTALLGEAPRHLSELSPGETAALAWLTEAITTRRLSDAVGERLLAIDFDQFLANVQAEIEKALGHFALPGGPELAAKMARSPTLGRYAKAPEHAYSRQLRDDVIRDSRQRNREEIARGHALLEKLGQDFQEVAETLGD